MTNQIGGEGRGALNIIAFSYVSLHNSVRIIHFFLFLLNVLLVFFHFLSLRDIFICSQIVYARTVHKKITLRKYMKMATFHVST